MLTTLYQYFWRTKKTLNSADRCDLSEILHSFMELQSHKLEIVDLPNLEHELYLLNKARELLVKVDEINQL